MEDLEQSNRLIFHGEVHVVATSVVSSALLRIEVEAGNGERKWRGEFPAGYVEGITQKTGSAKPFPLFVEMLLTALGHGSDSVFVDLLTYGDLEMLKAKRMASTVQQHEHQQERSLLERSGGSSGRGAANGNKRYLILTYAAEYDRVHYPLPLAPVVNLQPKAQERVSDGLDKGPSRRSSNGVRTSSPSRGEDQWESRTSLPVDEALESPSAARLAADNVDLRRQLEAMAARLEEAESSRRREADTAPRRKEGFDNEGEGAAGDGAQRLRRLRDANEELQAQLDDAHEAHGILRAESAAEIRRLRRGVRETDAAVASESSRAREAAEEVSALREEVQDVERQLREAEEAHRHETARLKKELAKERVTCRAMRAKLREYAALRGAPDPSAYQRLGASGSSGASRRGGNGGATSAGSGSGRSRLRSTGGSSGMTGSSSTYRSQPKRNGSATSARGRSPSSGLRGGWVRAPGGRANATNGGGVGVVRGRSRSRADSPRFRPPPPAGPPSWRGSGSRAPSPASSRGRSRSNSSRRASGEGGGPVAPMFDPTAYERERQERLRRLEDERRRRQRRDIGYSPGRSSGRDSWIAASGERDLGGARTAVSRGRTAERRSAGSGYASAGSHGSRASRASRTSRASSTRSRLSFSGGSDASSHTAQSRSRRRVRSARSAAADTVGGHNESRRNKFNAGGGGPSVNKRRTTVENPPLSTTARPNGRYSAATAPRGSLEVSPGRRVRSRHGSTAPAAAGARERTASPQLRPKTASSSPRNYPRRRASSRTSPSGRRFHSGGGEGRAGTGYLRLVRVSPHSSAASSSGEGANASYSARRYSSRLGRGVGGDTDSRGASWRQADAAGEEDLEAPHDARENGNGAIAHGGTRRPRLPSASEQEAGALRLPNPAREDSPLVDSPGEVGALPRDGNGRSDVFVPSASGSGLGLRYALQGPRAESRRYGGMGDGVPRAAPEEEEDPVAASRELAIGGGRGECGGGGGRAADLGSSGGSAQASGQRMARRRVELRTPAEEEAVRKSQELAKISRGDLDRRGAGAPASPALTATDERGAVYVNDSGASREISDIDRRLGELHEFLKRAKGGDGSGNPRLPVPAPSGGTGGCAEDQDPRQERHPPPPLTAEPAADAPACVGELASPGEEDDTRSLGRHRGPPPTGEDPGG